MEACNLEMRRRDQLMKWRIDRNIIAEIPEIDEKCLKIDFSYILESIYRYANSENHEL